jgi:hypothetical protein
MIMSEDVKNPELVEDVTSEAELQEEQVEELVEEEILDEESQEESLEEAKTEGKHEEEEEEDDKEESVKEEAPKVEIPKTKAGVIQAAVDMLKAARKEDAQKMFAKLVKIDGEEESIKSADAAMKGGKKAQDPKAKAKVENVDFDEDLDAIINEEATLSDGFRDKAGAIFEAVLTSKLGQEIERLESEYAQNLEEEVTDVQNDLVEKVNGYLDYVVENWMKENEVAVTQGLRTEIAEDFMTSLQSVFKEHYIEVPEGKVDLVDELNEQVNELEDTLNKTTQDNIDLHTKVQSYERASVVRDMSEGLVETDAEKLASLVEDIEFDNKENFEIKVKTVKESYFKSEVTESVDEVDSLLGSDAADENEKVVSSSMSQYTQAITKFNK